MSQSDAKASSGHQSDANKYEIRLAYYLDLWGKNIISSGELISILDYPEEHLLSEDEEAIKYVIE